MIFPRLRIDTPPTWEPHDELHPSADVDCPESIDSKGEREDVGSPTNQNQDQAPYDETEAEWRWDGEHLHTDVQKHNGLCRRRGEGGRGDIYKHIEIHIALAGRVYNV